MKVIINLHADTKATIVVYTVFITHYFLILKASKKQRSYTEAQQYAVQIYYHIPLVLSIVMLYIGIRCYYPVRSQHFFLQLILFPLTNIVAKMLFFYRLLVLT